MGMVITKVIIRIIVSKRYLEYIWTLSHSWDLALHTITHECCCWSESSKVKLKVKEEGERKKKEGEKNALPVHTMKAYKGSRHYRKMRHQIHASERTLVPIEQDLGGP